MTDTYYDNVFAYLWKLSSGVRIEISTITKPDTREEFIEAVKKYMRENPCVLTCIEFSNDYKFIRKFQHTFAGKI